MKGTKQQGQAGRQPKNLYKEAKDLEADLKAMKMMELVKALDDLAYDWLIITFFAFLLFYFMHLQFNRIQ